MAPGLTSEKSVDTNSELSLKENLKSENNNLAESFVIHGNTEKHKHCALTLAELCGKSCPWLGNISQQKGVIDFLQSKMSTADNEDWYKQQQQNSSNEQQLTTSSIVSKMGVLKSNTARLGSYANGTNKLHQQKVEPELPKTYTSVTSCTIVSGTPSSSMTPRSRPVTRSMTKGQQEVEKQVNSRQQKLQKRAHYLLRRLRRLQCREAASHIRHQISGVVDQHHLPVLTHANKMAASVSLTTDQCTEMDSVSGHLSSNLRHLQETMDSDATEGSSGGESCEEEDGWDWEWEGQVARPPLERSVSWTWSDERAAIASRWTWLQAQVSDLEYRIRQQNDIYRQIRQAKGEVRLLEPVVLPHLSTASTAPSLSTHSSTVSTAPSLSTHSSTVSTAPILSTSTSTTAAGGDNQLNAVMDNHCSDSTDSSKPLSNGSTDNSKPLSNGSTDNNKSLSNGSTDNTKPLPNGLLSPHHGSNTSPQGGAEEDTTMSARCKPLVLTAYRKRKLLRTKGVHLYETKAARLSSVKCSCYPPVTPCVLCGGRYNNTHPCDNPMTPVPERIALLDHSYHQVLSFKQDVSVSLHLESCVRSGVWSQRMHHLRTSGGQRPSQPKPRVHRSASAAVLERIKNKYEARRALSSRQSQAAGKKRLNSSHHGRLSASQHKLRSDRRTQSECLGGRDTPSPIPHVRKKKSESAFDINNIVIPYSIAASTRVERLQYKEIITPRWREVNESEKMSSKKSKRRSSNDVISPRRQSSETPSSAAGDDKPTFTLEPQETLEDLSDHMFTARHQRHEIEERKKFASCLPSHQGRRANRVLRGDSESTADVLSPAIGSSSSSWCEGRGGAGDSVSIEASPAANLSTPPPTPAPAHSDNLAGDTPAMEPPVARSRTLSVSSCISTHDTQEQWTKRTFPLSEADYSNLFKETPVTDKYQLRPLTRPMSHNNADNTARIGFYDDDEEEEDLLPSSRHSSVVGSSTSGSVADATDQEWTVHNIAQSSKKAGLVLKLSKR